LDSRHRPMCFSSLRHGTTTVTKGTSVITGSNNIDSVRAASALTICDFTFSSRMLAQHGGHLSHQERQQRAHQEIRCWQPPRQKASEGRQQRSGKNSYSAGLPSYFEQPGNSLLCDRPMRGASRLCVSPVAQNDVTARLRHPQHLL